MTTSPSISFHLSDVQREIRPGDSLWSAPVPTCRPGAAGIECRPSVTYGNYFSAVGRFLEQEDHRVLRVAVEGGPDPAPGDLRQIRIFLEKHGEFYHPARIEVWVGDRWRQFVLNVAVSEPGLSLIGSEYGLLRRLNRKFPEGYLPRAYGMGHVESDSGGRFSLFLGEWFPGYCEFHLSLDPESGRQRVRVWDPARDNPFLTEIQERRLYREAARIMTFYYDVETVSQIFPWHHAAGDFVADTLTGGLRLRLITVRNYAPIYPGGCPDLVTRLEALLIFFLNLTVRTRLDRLDGVGAVAWAGDAAVGETLRGVLGTLALKPETGDVPAPIAELFRFYLGALSGSDIAGRLVAVAEGYAARPEEYRLVRARIADHGAVLKAEIDRWRASDSSEAGPTR